MFLGSYHRLQLGRKAEKVGRGEAWRGGWLEHMRRTYYTYIRLARDAAMRHTGHTPVTPHDTCAACTGSLPPNHLPLELAFADESVEEVCGNVGVPGAVGSRDLRLVGAAAENKTTPHLAATGRIRSMPLMPQAEGLMAAAPKKNMSAHADIIMLSKHAVLGCTACLNAQYA